MRKGNVLGLVQEQNKIWREYVTQGQQMINGAKINPKIDLICIQKDYRDSHLKIIWQLLFKKIKSKFVL